MSQVTLITGANGFVGLALCSRLLGVMPIRACVRNDLTRTLPTGIEIAKVDLSKPQGWIEALTGVSVVIHCAARVHVMNDKADDPLTEFRRVNVIGTLQLARLAADLGVRRFIYLSSVKVNGEKTSPCAPFSADQTPVPTDPYGISKYEAEIGLQRISKDTGMEIVIIRPPLVYGPGVSANFLSMMRWLKNGVPLPLGGITENRRSLLYIENLVDLITICIDHPNAASQIFLVSDDEDLSTATLLRKMSIALARPSRLVRISPPLIYFAARLIGRPGLANRLCSSLQLDIKKTKDLLGWSPPVSVDMGLRQTAAHFLKT